MTVFVMLKCDFIGIQVKGNIFSLGTESAVQSILIDFTVLRIRAAVLIHRFFST